MSTAYTTEKTWTTGDDATAALFNTHIRDNSQFLHGVPCCRVYNSANISIANGGTGTALTFNSERKDNDTMHSTSSLTGRLVATTAGFYDAGAGISFNNTSTTGVRELQLRLNGTALFAKQAGTGSSDHLNVSSPYQFAAADYFEVIAYQNSGGALNVIAAGNSSPEAWAAWQAA